VLKFFCEIKGDTMVDAGREIAKRGLEIGAIKLWPEEGPFLWACNSYMPIYNDNRRFLGTYADRMMIAEGFRDMMDEKGLKPDFIAGTSTSGIAPAASLAQLTGIPLIIQNNGGFYVFDDKVMEQLSLDGVVSDEAQLVVSTCPFAIPSAVQAANACEMPFAYVRVKKKGHGLKKQIEGVVQPGQQAVLGDYHIDNDYTDIAIAVLREEGVNVLAIKSKRLESDTSYLLRQPDISGAHILQIEDLVSTGGSCIKEIQAYRDNGARVTDCFSIFNYQLAKAQAQFQAADVNLSAQLVYQVLLEETVRQGVVTGDKLAILQEWRDKDPFKWGANHGLRYPFGCCRTRPDKGC
jgi:orotate phosphoribosyltransferase